MLFVQSRLLSEEEIPNRSKLEFENVFTLEEINNIELIVDFHRN